MGGGGVSAFPSLKATPIIIPFCSSTLPVGEGTLRQAGDLLCGLKEATSPPGALASPPIKRGQNSLCESVDVDRGNSESRAHLADPWHRAMACPMRKHSRGEVSHVAFIGEMAVVVATPEEGWGLRDITASRTSSRSPGPA